MDRAVAITAATKDSIIFGRTSTISSQSRKTEQPSCGMHEWDWKPAQPRACQAVS